MAEEVQVNAGLTDGVAVPNEVIVGVTYPSVTDMDW
jgi:hypothetical protein